ncbi:hypothetical protein ROLI_039170 [Roseobacter fucihabitans]|uniref:Uncharacterized protein n=1 Tax=Roseobacter fucihabitans TaxID=1537242 RepID=A0ABZ2C0F0_9RHOB
MICDPDLARDVGVPASSAAALSRSSTQFNQVSLLLAILFRDKPNDEMKFPRRFSTVRRGFQFIQCPLGVLGEQLSNRLSANGSAPAGRENVIRQNWCFEDDPAPTMDQ